VPNLYVVIAESVGMDMFMFAQAADTDVRLVYLLRFISEVRLIHPEILNVCKSLTLDKSRFVIPSVADGNDEAPDKSIPVILGKYSNIDSALYNRLVSYDVSLDTVTQFEPYLYCPDVLIVPVSIAQILLKKFLSPS